MRQNKVLVLTSGNNAYTIYPQAGNQFFHKERDLVFEFIQDTNGRPLKIIVKEGGTLADELIFQK